MPYNHKISDLKYIINGLVPKTVCQKIIEIFEKYPELLHLENSYKFKTNKKEIDDFDCLNLSIQDYPNLISSKKIIKIIESKNNNNQT